LIENEYKLLWKKKYFAQYKKKNHSSQMWTNPRGGAGQKSEPEIKLRGRPTRPALCGPKRVGLTSFAIPNYSSCSVSTRMVTGWGRDEFCYPITISREKNSS